MINREEAKKVNEIIQKIKEEMNLDIKIITKEWNFSIIFTADMKHYPNEKILIIYTPKSTGLNNIDDFFVTFAFEKETTLMMSDPRKNLKLADKVIEKIKEGLKYES